MDTRTVEIEVVRLNTIKILGFVKFEDVKVTGGRTRNLAELRKVLTQHGARIRELLDQEIAAQYGGKDCE